MKCAWDSFLQLLPQDLRVTVDKLGRDSLQELRLRLGGLPILITSRGNRIIDRTVSAGDLQHIVNAASRYSPWAAETICEGYVTADGGHRIGLCGSVAIHSDCKRGYRSITSLCMRVARDFPGIARNAVDIYTNTLILGPPGSGKTTLLRDLVRQLSVRGMGSIVVVDERCEVFPMTAGNYSFERGMHTDVISGCGKKHGVELAIRTMGAAWVAVDEISSEEDCEAIYKAGWCGVPILATAHADGLEDFLKRPVYKPLVANKVFDRFLVLQKDKSWKEERLPVCT